MLRLLLDEHISRKVANQVKKGIPGLDVLSIHDWENGRFLATNDGEILRVAARHNLTLVTYDQNTIFTHMAEIVSEGCDHGGIVVIDGKTIRQSDIGGLVKALCWLYEAESRADWKNRTVYLQAKGRA
jgi:Domain of unknown function (DUF5615)